MRTTFYLLGLTFILTLFSFTNTEKKMRIVIDAGHGGKDNGVEVNDITEKEITEAISRKIKFLNNKESVEVIVIRDKDEFMDLTDRVNKINALKPDLVISLHINSAQDSTVNGFEVFVGEKNTKQEDSKIFAETLLNATPKSLTKREVKEANFYLLNNVECPAVLLELGFLTNNHDRDFLESQLGQQKLALMVIKSL